MAQIQHLKNRPEEWINEAWFTLPPNCSIVWKTVATLGQAWLLEMGRWGPLKVPFIYGSGPTPGQYHVSGCLPRLLP